MNKWIIRAIALFMAGVLLLGIVSMVFADENENVLTITNVQEFLEFAENCRLDSYSVGLVVQLTADIDLTGQNFNGIPIFCGEFYGNGHTISGLSITATGSNQGLFRYLTETALVNGLTVSGTVHPQGSKSYVGGIAGSNSGKIENCIFTAGKINGADHVGGIAGINTETGVISGCSVNGTIHGNHFVGGIAGENHGNILSCVNQANINTTPEQNKVDISDVTMDTILGTETTITVTDLGGIVGSSSGTILGCTNQGDVGYPYMGYNVGGIAGSQSGILGGCTNYGNVNGRKEVGGIVGQLEPFTTISFDADTLQILQTQVADLSALTKQLSANAKENLSNVETLVGKLEKHTADLEKADADITALLENPQVESIEDLQKLLETLNEKLDIISSSIDGISTTTKDLYAAIKDTTSDLETDLDAVSAQVEVLENTLNNATDNLGGSVVDVSDQADLIHCESSVDGCQNFGQVLADLNAGGIVGAIAVESDLDPDEDVQIVGSNTLNYNVEVRSVIRGCINNGKVLARKQHLGGIVGWMSLGLTADCVNLGAVDGSQAEYVGGVAGSSLGFIRRCSAKCALTGKNYVGGIAGEADDVSNCYSMTQLTASGEKVGLILGYADHRDAIAGNFYVVLDKDLGAIDGISYDACAQSLNWDEFKLLEALPEQFLKVTVTFLYDDGTSTTLEVPMGESISVDSVPKVPEIAGSNVFWEGLKEEDLQNIRFDRVYTLTHTAMSTVIESQQSVAGVPVLLVQGQFGAVEKLQLSELTVADAVEGWAFNLPQGSQVTALRYLLPQECEGQNVQIMVRSSVTGDWQLVEHTMHGRYAVFAADETVDGVHVVMLPKDYTLHMIIAGAAAALLVTIVVIVIVQKKKNRK